MKSGCGCSGLGRPSVGRMPSSTTNMPNSSGTEREAEKYLPCVPFDLLTKLSVSRGVDERVDRTIHVRENRRPNESVLHPGAWYLLGSLKGGADHQHDHEGEPDNHEEHDQHHQGSVVGPLLCQPDPGLLLAHLSKEVAVTCCCSTKISKRRNSLVLILQTFLLPMYKGFGSAFFLYAMKN